MDASQAQSTSTAGEQANMFQNVGRQVERMRLGDPAGPEGDTEDDGEQKVVDVIESLCMNCHENVSQAVARVYLEANPDHINHIAGHDTIPYFKEIILMSFDCPHCNFRNSEIQSAGEIQQRGSKYALKLDHADDLQRQIVKSDTCVFRVEDLDLEIPAGRGQLTNVEGLLSMVLGDLEGQQPERKRVIPEVYEKIEGIIQRLKSMIDGSTLPFSITVDDPAGNSWIEPSPKDRHGKYSKKEYPRTSEQNAALSLGDPDPQEETMRPEYKATQLIPQMQADDGEGLEDADIVEGQVYTFPSNCPGCMRDCATHMKMVEIPHFKQVVLMSTACEHCGYRSNEVKTGGAVPEQGRRITLNVQNTEDLGRDILKSESCALSCPELSLDVQPGTLGGRFTTVEGLLTNVRDDLHKQIFDTDDGTEENRDSIASSQKDAWKEFFDNLSAAIKVEKKFTLILQDPLAASYIQSFTAPDPDAQITVEDYNRTEEEEEDLGLKDMVTEGYEAGHAAKVESARIDAAKSIGTEDVLAKVNEQMAQIAKEEKDGE
ncbi:MAG: hypothetical protein M1819_001490 [Sarea resinae]|nr:MAG: hypothetical protein M1819_001490 [Sarea resinae]